MRNLDELNLTEEEELAIAARYLDRLEPDEKGRLPYEIFLPVARLIVLHTVEVGFVRPSEEEEDGAQVLLTQRPPTDRHWANQWHIPGSVVTAVDPVKHDHDYDAAISRVMDEIGGGLQLVSEPSEFDTVRRKGQRGSEVTVRLLAEVEGEPEKGKFFDAAGVLRKPPEGGLLETHDVAIQKVADRYAALRSGR